ncbi:MAG TPA: NUDIX domain-containing protein [Anaerolineales bacterium]|jgi:predicted NUDIX family NTP pyrophosphohydrolase|nr:NUDIX domain-containing protein [Anaerolineales bacterium]
MNKESSGILLYRQKNDQLEILLVHPGGPFWKKKDLGAWSIPKGEFADEDPLSAAKREFEEEIGMPIDGEMIALTPQQQKAGKVVHAWAVEGDLNPEEIRSNTFEMEWPPKSGKKQAFPEIDRAEWFPVQTARKKINQGQVAFIQELIEKLDLQG